MKRARSLILDEYIQTKATNMNTRYKINKSLLPNENQEQVKKAPIAKPMPKSLNTPHLPSYLKVKQNKGITYDYEEHLGTKYNYH